MENKLKKMINNSKVKDISNITSDKRDSLVKKTVLNFSKTDIPKGYYNILSKWLCYKIAKERLPLSDIISGIDDATKNISAAYIANSFRAEYLNVLRKGRPKNQKTFNKKLCNDIRKWLKDDKLVLIEAEKGRATFIIDMQNIDEMVKEEVNKREKNVEIKKR